MHDDPARVSPAPTLGGLLSAVHAQRRRWGSAARHAAALSRPVRGGVGQLDAVAASQNLLQWRMVALLNMLAKLPGKDECCWCTTQC